MMHAWQMVVLMTSDAEGLGQSIGFATLRWLGLCDAAMRQRSTSKINIEIFKRAVLFRHPVAFSFGISSALERSTYRVDGTGL